jgi:hypothetical protein
LFLHCNGKTSFVQFQPFSRRINAVKSIGKPKVSYNSNALLLLFLFIFNNFIQQAILDLKSSRKKLPLHELHL